MNIALSYLKNFVVIVILTISVLFFIINSLGQKFIVKVGCFHDDKIENCVSDVINILKSEHLVVVNQSIDSNNNINLEFSSIEEQIKARDMLQSSLGNSYDISLRLLPNLPLWLQHMGIQQMPLGLDLRGGVHFLLQLDNKDVIKKHLEANVSKFKYLLLKDNLSFTNFVIESASVTIFFANNNIAQNAYKVLTHNFAVNNFAQQEATVVFKISDSELEQITKYSLQQNIMTLHNRVNGLGVSEPIIQQQGNNRILVELPGIQDVKRAKNILGRIVSLEVHLVSDDPHQITEAFNGKLDDNHQLLYMNRADQKIPVLIDNNIELTGDTINDARVGFDEEGLPVVNLTFNDIGAGIFKKLTANNIGKRLALVIVDNGHKQVITAPVVRAEISGGQVQISGAMAVDEAEDIALLLRSGSLVTPMSVLQEQIVGPSLGHDNIMKGIYSVLGGFILLMFFMCYYYRRLGVIAVISLLANLLVLVMLLSLLHATLTLSGVVAMALTLGIAIDANVLINESIKEFTNGSEEYILESGYKHAWSTIVDSNITIFIVGIALFAFASGSVKGFAVVHCLGILSSVFSVMFVTKPLLKLFYNK